MEHARPDAAEPGEPEPTRQLERAIQALVHLTGKLPSLSAPACRAFLEERPNVESGVRAGSTFRVWFPALPPTEIGSA